VIISRGDGLIDTLLNGTPEGHEFARRNMRRYFVRLLPRANQGIWYITKDDSVSVGLFGPTILKALSEIAAETGRF
jgi:hypothetical protein